MATTDPQPPQGRAADHTWVKVLFVFVLLFVFLSGISVLSHAIKDMGKGVMDTYMAGATNPFAGLIVGVLATTLVQSSSVTTSLIVALVAAGTVPVHQAIPMVMGANIGTTVTSTVAALGHMGHKAEFRRAFGAATCHDFFNYLAVIVLLPIELATGFLEKSSAVLARNLTATESGKFKSPLKVALKTVDGLVRDAVDLLDLTVGMRQGVLCFVGVVLIYTALLFIVKTMRSLVLDRMRVFLSRALDRTAIVGIMVGTLLTFFAQSSSITTSVLVPLAGAGLITVRQVFPIILGCNVGTTMTALIASLAVTGEFEAIMAGRQIALVHLLFNLTGIALVYAIPRAKDLPVYLASRLADVAVESKLTAFVYLVGAFYLLPCGLFLLFR
jgi:sodium-dependent phosphate cotransporter